MKNKEISKTINQLLESQKMFSNAIENYILEYYPFIIEVGALTVYTNENGVVEAQNVEYPMQFSQKGVDEILEMTWRNGNGEIVQPIVYGRNAWYRNRLKRVNETLELFQKTFSNES